MKKDKSIRVNICWELKKERRCETLSKEQAYALRKDVEKEGGLIFWFQPLDDWVHGAWARMDQPLIVIIGFVKSSGSTCSK